MSRPNRPICVKCQKEYRVKKQGVVTEIMTTFSGGKLTSYEIYSSDLWECPMCGHQIVGGFGQQPLAVHFQEDYKKVLERYSSTSQVFKCY